MNRLSYSIIPPLRRNTRPSRQALPIIQTITTKTTRSHATKCQHSNPKPSHEEPISSFSLPFWTSSPTWRRASVNTFRCLIGCTTGDFTSLWILQSFYPDLGMGVIMGASSMHPPLFSSSPSPHGHPLSPIISTSQYILVYTYLLTSKQ